MEAKQKKKILIIDDEKNFAHLVKLNLELTGNYEVREEDKGEDGLVAAKQFKPDLILLDVIMPDMQGGEVALQLREDEETKDIPVIFLTAAAKKEEVSSRNATIGGYPLIAKPVSVNELIDYIEKNIG
jgi:CheY-like chemotaxis protein